MTSRGSLERHGSQRMRVALNQALARLRLNVSPTSYPRVWRPAQSSTRRGLFRRSHLSRQAELASPAPRNF